MLVRAVVALLVVAVSGVLVLVATGRWAGTRLAAGLTLSGEVGSVAPGPGRWLAPEQVTGTGPDRGVREATLRPPVDAPVTSGYGRRTLFGVPHLHAGTDLGADRGTPVLAAGPGVVTWAGDAAWFGRAVVVDHGGGLSTLYAHLDAVGVRPGATVAAGTTLGTIGSTGGATGPHLHLEVRRSGLPVDVAVP